MNIPTFLLQSVGESVMDIQKGKNNNTITPRSSKHTDELAKRSKGTNLKWSHFAKNEVSKHSDE